VRRVLYGISGDGGGMPVLPKRSTFLESMPDPETLPAWLGEADIDFYAGEFARTGFRGGLNWYRNLDRTWELMAAWRGARITVPALFVAGDRDPVILRSRAAMDGLAETVPGLRERVLLPGAGHWTQQERPAEVNDALITFLAGLPRE
jgi:pimeloyl-ACP methyl ester carboxylesterase